MPPLDNPDSIHNNFLREIRTQQPKKLIIIKPIAYIGLSFEYLAEIVEKALAIDDRFAEGTVGFEDNVFAFVALV